MTGVVAGAINKPKGFAQYTSIGSSTALTAAPTTGLALPDGCIRALIQAEAQDVRWTDDGLVTPTAAIGMLLKANTVLEYEGDLTKFRMIQAVGGAIVNISYYAN